jgi:TM2 domain-containing membrane protein YozV
MFWTTWKIIYLVIEQFTIHSGVSFWIVKTDNVVYDEFINLLVYDNIRDELFESNNIWSIILTK